MPLYRLVAMETPEQRQYHVPGEGDGGDKHPDQRKRRIRRQVARLGLSSILIHLYFVSGS